MKVKLGTALQVLQQQLSPLEMLPQVNPKVGIPFCYIHCRSVQYEMQDRETPGKEGGIMCVPHYTHYVT